MQRRVFPRRRRDTRRPRSDDFQRRAQLVDRLVRPLDDALAPFMLSTAKYEGDRSKWVLEVLATTELVSIEKIARLLEHQWQSGAKWTKTGQTGLETQWELVENPGEKWAGKM